MMTLVRGLGAQFHNPPAMNLIPYHEAMSTLQPFHAIGTWSHDPPIMKPSQTKAESCDDLVRGLGAQFHNPPAMNLIPYYEVMSALWPFRAIGTWLHDPLIMRPSP